MTILLSAITLIVGIWFLKQGRNFLSLIFLTYVYLDFVVGYGVYDISRTQEGLSFFSIIVANFLLGRGIAKLPFKMVLPFKLRLLGKTYTPSVEYSNGLEDYMIRAAIIFNILSLAYAIGTMGFLQFYSGAALVGEIKDYANPSPTRGLMIVIGSTIGTLTTAAIAIYAKRKNRSIILMLFVLIVLPIIGLQRGAMVSGAISLLYTYSNKIKTKAVLLLAAISIIVVVVIGGLRATSLNSQQSTGPLQLVVGELSVVQCVQLIVDTVRDNGIQYGRTIVEPALTLFIPRSIYPSKPSLTSAEITQKYFPDNAVAGFYLAPTVFGDAYYNFGYIGMSVISMLLGALTFSLDKSRYSYLGFIVSYQFYSIMRNNLPQSITAIGFGILFCQFYRINFWRLINPGAAKPCKVNDRSSYGLTRI